jgi:AcrR family transcriptional regulator
MTSKSLATLAPARSARRSAILEAALDCFDRLGYANATIDDVRLASGASVGSIYHHFGDKEGLAGSLYVEALRRYQASLLGAAEGFRGARGLVRGIVAHYIDWTLSNPQWARFLFETRRAEGVAAVESDIRRETRAFFERLADRLARHVQRGEIRPLPMPLMAALLIGPAQELARHWLRAGAPDELEDLKRELADAAWRALNAQPSTGRDPS